MEEYESDYEIFGKKPSNYDGRVFVQNLSNQVAKLSELEFDDSKREELLSLPQEIQSMKDENENESKELRNEVNLKIEELSTSHKQTIQDMEESQVSYKPNIREKLSTKQENDQI